MPDAYEYSRGQGMPQNVMKSTTLLLSIEQYGWPSQHVTAAAWMCLEKLA